MDIKKITDKALNFILNRIAELIGLSITISSILLFISLMSYSPEDPNFVFSNNAEIKNLLGLKGSYVSDLFFQSIGLISILIPLSLFFTGFNILRKKNFLIILENIFFIIIYSILGCLFFSAFHKETYWLIINGNNGFVGNLFTDSFLINLINSNNKISYYLLILLIISIFLISINFNLKYFYNFFTSILNFSSKKNKNSSYEEMVKEDFLQEKIQETRIQENFLFDRKSYSLNKNTFKFKLPSIEFLKKPTKKERERSEKKDIDETFLEKILLDFGVEGKIKKISYGPVVTLNEFEPAPGVKVSKIINLSEDIARNTSSESARISTIPGSSTIGIELPNLSRENVYLSEIVSSASFSKKNIKLLIALGKNISGEPITGDLFSMPPSTNRWNNWIWKIGLY